MISGHHRAKLKYAIFRACSGQIVIDGVNISTIGLHDLRSRLSIIPQDPTMFEGTIRSNLDPLEEYTNDKIWEFSFYITVTENGENWSVGQRQHVCLGLMLLKKSKVLVLDEATTSVDTATDGMIQQTLNLHFNDSYVIIIAHRFTYVLDSDMYIGFIEEYDSPTKLLEDKLSSFAKLVTE
ncbi:multidrug resistance-associated protein 3 [Artemisia annua]|uniref:Multidrug resistance-associated protein 3 n=1 Tax=Artemisia annua TaxID=35608 RepID=A0A2U1LII8_ARTAN|nr:multidrug resistance-associated protein 3 [Artemisia annua]